MDLPQPLLQATLIKRYKRFLADVRLNDGSVITVHCPNTGSMQNCAQPGWSVWLSLSDNPKRKYAHTWELVAVDQQLACVNTQRPNHIVAEAFAQQKIGGFEHYQHLQQEVRYGEENSRIDILLTDDQLQRCYVEVKSVTLCSDDSGQGMFPDAVSQRASKHLREMINMVQQGYRAVLFYCVPHNGIKRVSVAKHIDAKYYQHLQQAMLAGVEVLAYRAKVTTQAITITEQLDFEL